MRILALIIVCLSIVNAFECGCCDGERFRIASGPCVDRGLTQTINGSCSTEDACQNNLVALSIVKSSPGRNSTELVILQGPYLGTVVEVILYHFVTGTITHINVFDTPCDNCGQPSVLPECYVAFGIPLLAPLGLNELYIGTTRNIAFAGVINIRPLTLSLPKGCCADCIDFTNNRCGVCVTCFDLPFLPAICFECRIPSM